MPDTDFGELANTRINRQLEGFRDIKSKEEYFDKLEDFLSGSENGRNMLNARKKPFEQIREEMFEESNAKRIVQQNEIDDENLKGRAIRFEAARGRAGIQDERRTARDTREITSRNYLTWRNRPSRLDLRGIDTRRARSARGISPKRARAISLTKADKRLVNFRPYIDLKRRTKVYRSAKTGKFTRSPFKSRKQK